MNFIKGILKKDERSFFLETSPGYTIFLGTEISAALNDRINDELEIGIRPENIIVSQQKNNINEASIAEVMAFENMGNEQLIYLSLKGQSLIARRSAQDLIEIGSSLSVSFPADKIIFIDPLSGKIYMTINN